MHSVQFDVAENKQSQWYVRVALDNTQKGFDLSKTVYIQTESIFVNAESNMSATNASFFFFLFWSLKTGIILIVSNRLSCTGWCTIVCSMSHMCQHDVIYLIFIIQDSLFCDAQLHEFIAILKMRRKKNTLFCSIKSNGLFIILLQLF